MAVISHFILWALSVVILFECGITAPPPLKHSKRSFRVHRRQYGSGQREASRELRKAYQKFGIPLTTGLLEPAADNANHESIAKATNSSIKKHSGNPDAGDVEFLAPITIGGQQLMMNFDTGSSDLWVFSTLLPASKTQGHTPFDPAKSKSFKKIPGATFSVKFGDGSSAAGNVVGTDIVDIGGATATSQAVELATTVADSFVEDTSSNGLVGLGFSKINAVKPKAQKTFFDTIQHDLALPVLTAKLRHEADGFYEFGKIDSGAFQGRLSTTPVDSSRGFWQFGSSKYQVGDGEVQQNRASGQAIADTGTTLMLVDDEVAEAYYKQVPGASFDEAQGMFTFPCETQLPDFKVALGPEYMATISGSILNFSRVDRNRCAGGLQGNQGSDLQIYGDILFKSQFAVFNIRDLTVSFADHS